MPSPARTRLIGSPSHSPDSPAAVRSCLDDHRRLERERAVKAVVVFLPYGANARDVLGFAATPIGFVDGDENASALFVQLYQLIRRRLSSQFAGRDKIACRC